MALVWHTAKRPGSELQDCDFELREVADAPLGDGEVRVRNTWLSIDPYVRGLLDDEGSYMPTMPLGSQVPGGAVGEVVESRAASLPVGTEVLHDFGWRSGAVMPAEACRAVGAPGVPIQRYLGHLGMPGQTAYFGLLDVLDPQAGEVLFVSAAAGAVAAGAMAAAGASAAPSPCSTKTSEPCLTLSPNCTFSSCTTPPWLEGISMEALSDSTVIRLCSGAMVSPGLTSISMTVTSSKSPMSGTWILISAMSFSIGWEPRCVRQRAAPQRFKGARDGSRQGFGRDRR